MHPLRVLLDDAADGRFPPADGEFDVFAPERAGHLAIVQFTGHSVVVADVSHAELAELGADGFGGASHPDVKRRLAGPDGSIGTHDAVLVARGRGRARPRATGGPGLERRDDLVDHPRVVRARAHRTEVEVHGDDAGFVTIGRGLVGRRELSVELLPGAAPGVGTGRRLVTAGLELVPAGEPVWAQVSPGNAASLRAFLACGFVPVGAETLIVTG